MESIATMNTVFTNNSDIKNIAANISHCYRQAQQAPRSASFNTSAYSCDYISRRDVTNTKVSIHFIPKNSFSQNIPFLLPTVKCRRTDGHRRIFVAEMDSMFVTSNKF